MQKVAASSLNSRACLLLAASPAQAAFQTWLEGAGGSRGAAIDGAVLAKCQPIFKKMMQKHTFNAIICSEQCVHQC